VTDTDETTRNPEKRQPRGLARFADANPVVVVSSIGAVAYFVARAAQTSFYSKFGVEPEDVGLGYAQTLSRAAPGLLALTVVVGAIAFVLVRPWRYHDPQGDQRRIGPFARWLIGSTLCSLLVLAVWMPFAYDSRADDVKHGKPVRPPGLSTAYRLVTNPLGLRAVPVHVSWIGDVHAYDFQNEVVYLGRADGIAIFFDPTNQRTVRVPQTDIVIERKG